MRLVLNVRQEEIVTCQRMRRVIGSILLSTAVVIVIIDALNVNDTLSISSEGRAGRNFSPQRELGLSSELQASSKSSPRTGTSPGAREIDVIAEARLREREQERIILGIGEVPDIEAPDMSVDEIERFLSTRYPRPWTVSRIESWYDAAADVDAKLPLLEALSLSDDTRAIGALIKESASSNLEVASKAREMLLARHVPYRSGTWAGSRSKDFDEFLRRFKSRNDVLETRTTGGEQE